MPNHDMFGRKLTAREAELYLGGDTMALFRQQLMLVLLDRLGGEVTIPAEEVDTTGRLTMEMEIDQDTRAFKLSLGRKS